MHATVQGPLHLRDVKAAGEDVRGNQDLRSAAPELLHGAVPLLVIQLAGYAGASVTLCLQLRMASSVAGLLQT